MSVDEQSVIAVLQTAIQIAHSSSDTDPSTAKDIARQAKFKNIVSQSAANR